MKRLYVNILSFTALLCSCSHAEVLLPQEPQAEQPVALELSMSTAELTKALVKDTRLPDGSSEVHTDGPLCTWMNNNTKPQIS